MKASVCHGEITCDHADTFMAKGDEMFSSEIASKVIVNSNSRNWTAFNCTEEEHERKIFINERFKDFPFKVGRGDNKAVYLAFPKDLYQVFLLRILVVRVSENNLDVLWVGIFLDTQGGIGENRIADGRDDEPNGFRFLGNETTGERVILVVTLFHCKENFFPGLFAHGMSRIDDSRHRGG